MRVLVVEDHVELAETVASVLRREGIAVDVAHNGTDALSRTAVIDYDVVVLDRDLPGVHGDQVCRTLVASKCRTRVLMLTASSTIADRVEGLGLGADDYLPKPFAFAELIARIRALARRSQLPLPPILEHRDVRLDPATAGRHPGGAAIGAQPEGARRARVSASRPRSRRVRRGAARAGLGRGGRPIHDQP